MSYEGWTTYETWAVKLWMDNEEGSYLYVREMAGEVIDEGGDRYELAQRLEAEYEEARPEVEGVWADLLGHAFECVEWGEIADALISEVIEEREYEEANR